jgi:hypothetical protein
MSRFMRVFARALRPFGRILRVIMLSLGALGPGMPAPPASPRRQAEAQIVEQKSE